MRIIRRAAAVAAGALVLVAAGAAAAATTEPLNPYVVSGTKANADALARAGYDLIEGSLAGGKFAIVATAKQAAALSRKGMTVTAAGGAARASARAAAAPVLANPTHGYDVFRPWNLTAAPCPSDPRCDTRSLKQIYDDLAAANPDIVTRVVYGSSQFSGQELVAYKVTSRSGPRRKPTVLYNSVQHAREWIAAETNRRLFAYYVANKNNRATDIPAILRTTEVWFVPIVNPDGYDYTFQSKATRLWRKNLRDVNGDGQITSVDGVDPNRNWETKWNYDLEGSSADSTSETYHGTAGDSESEVAALDALTARIRPKFQIDYHSFGNLILYPEGWQVETLATDGPLFLALAGDDRKPAIPNYDPDVSAELYTVNGDITDNSLEKYGTQAVTVELEGGSGPPVGGTLGDDESFFPGQSGFVFQDSESEVQRVFQDNLAYALDLAKSARTPDRPVSHLGNTAPNFVPTEFTVSTGSPQVVEVNAKRSLGRVQVRYRINGGAVRTAPTREFTGGEKYGHPGVYYHKLRGTVRGARPGDTVEVWFRSDDERSASFTYTQKSATGNPVLILSAEDYAGPSGRPGSSTGPRYLDFYKKALDDNGVAYDVYDTGGLDRVAPSALGVLSHYKSVIMYTGDDLYTRAPGQLGGTGSTKLLDDEIVAMRDYLNEGGKALVTGQNPLQGASDGFLYNPLGPTPPNPFCPGNTTNGNGNADDPVDDDGNVVQVENCVAISNDFLQYWLGAYLNVPVPVGPPDSLSFVGAGGAFGGTLFSLNGADSAQNQGWFVSPTNPGNNNSILSFLTTSSILNPATYPQFASERAVGLGTGPAFAPPSGASYAYSRAIDDGYKRLATTVDLTGTTTASMSFKMFHDTEQDWDFVFVEAHVVGTDVWTTLPDTNGNTTQDTGQSCPQIPIIDTHPQLGHYMTLAPDGASCTPSGTTGVWNGASGNSGGFQDWSVDLSAYAGKQVEVSISYFSDPAVQGLGVIVDDVIVTKNGTAGAAESFENGLGTFTVPGAPEGSPGNGNDWIVTPGFEDGPGVATADTLLWGFGFEGVSNKATRAALMKDALTYLGGGAVPTVARVAPTARTTRAVRRR